MSVPGNFGADRNKRITEKKKRSKFMLLYFILRLNVKSDNLKHFISLNPDQGYRKPGKAVGFLRI